MKLRRAYEVQLKNIKGLPPIPKPYSFRSCPAPTLAESLPQITSRWDHGKGSIATRTPDFWCRKPRSLDCVIVVSD
ncbi:hypothetical protein WAI453_011693 [Rhynchosporium graminicola]